MLKKLFYIVCLLTCLQGICFGQSINDTPELSFAEINNSEIIRPAYYKEILGQLADSKENSFSLRLWTTTMFGHSVLTFRKYKEQWQAHKYSYYSDPVLKEQKLKPGISLTAFVDSLEQVDFDSLISQNEIKGFKDDVDDGITYTLEITTQKSYKIFQYHSPETFAEKEINNKRFSNVIRLLNRYFKSY